MLTELKKSINSILYERTTSPFFGTLIVSWILYNWRIFYFSFFVSEDKISGTKIDYVINNYCNNKWILIGYPVISTVIILTMVPFISNGAFWFKLKFRKWRIDKKNEIEAKQLLTLEKSVQIRQEIANQLEEFEKINKSKNDEIKELKELIRQLKEDNGKNNNQETKSKKKSSKEDFEKLANKIITNEKFREGFDRVIFNIRHDNTIGEGVSSREIINLLEANNIFEKKGNHNVLTEAGMELYRMITNERYLQ